MRAPQSNSKDFEACPVGYSLGVCTRVIDKGTHWFADKYNPSEGKYQRKISIAFESQHLMKEGEFAGEPFLIYGNFNYSMFQGKAFLCNFIEDWRGKRFSDQDEANDFDLSKLIGQKAFMNIVRSDDGKFTNIQTIGPVPDGMTAPEIKGKTILIDQDNLDSKEVEKLSEKMRTTVTTSKEQTEGNFQNAGTTAAQPETMSENPGHGLTDADAGFDDSLPF